MNKTFTTQEVAILFNVNQRTVERWINNFKLDGYRSKKSYGRHKRWLVSEDSLLSFLGRKYTIGVLTFTEFSDIQKKIKNFPSK